MQLHSRLARLRTGAMGGFALTHARLRVLRVIASRRGDCISDIARELDLSRQAVHRVVHDLLRMRLITLTESSRSGRARVPRLAAAGRVAVKCGVGWESQWFERLGKSAATRELRWLYWLAQRYRRHLPWRADEDIEPEMPATPAPSARRRVSPWRPAPAPAAGSGCAARAVASR
jgi:DNA-binding MarR family transcriptional regulator